MDNTIAFVKHKAEIVEYLDLQKRMAEEERLNAKEEGLLQTCQCCFDDEVMPNDIGTCDEALHIFCKSCIKLSTEVLIGEGRLRFPCLENCESHFNLQTLQAALDPKLFSKMVQRQQLEEVQAAGIDDLESCPFCNFATIPAPGDRIFRCMNDDCMKESCRECHEISHIPLRCDEVEKEPDVKMRTYIEDKMTEALLRTCWKCGAKFIKEDGCNMMTCSCGAKMCYVCNQAVKDYTHFNGQGGDNHHLCPLYSNLNELHKRAVKRGAANAKKELGLGDSNKQLKIDPSDGIDKFFKKK